MSCPSRRSVPSDAPPRARWASSSASAPPAGPTRLRPAGRAERGTEERAARSAAATPGQAKRAPTRNPRARRIPPPSPFPPALRLVDLSTRRLGSSRQVAAGFDGVLLKPVTADKLASIIAPAPERPRLGEREDVVHRRREEVGRRSPRIVSRIVRTMLRRVSARVPSKSKMARRMRASLPHPRAGRKRAAAGSAPRHAPAFIATRSRAGGARPPSAACCQRPGEPSRILPKEISANRHFADSGDFLNHTIFSANCNYSNSGDFCLDRFLRLP